MSGFLWAEGAPTGWSFLELDKLHNFETHGYSLNEVLGGTSSISKTSDLYAKNAFYKSFADALGKPLKYDPKTDQLPDVIPADSGDIPDMVRELRGFEDKGARSDKDLTKGFKIRKLSNNSQYHYAVERDGDEPRYFDVRWLNSPFAYFKLIAVVNRMDRMDITKDSCGEVRFIYRLSYKSKAASSTLPFFINVVEQYPKEISCARFAKAWLGDESAPLKGLAFRQLEVNFQSLRFTSGYMHDFGGQAMYMQRIFRKTGQKLIPVALENTPDVRAVEKDPSLLKRFVEYLKRPENLRALDEGTLNINFDPKFLATRSVSWSTLGRARAANRPYAEIFRTHPGLIETIDMSGLKYIKSRAALVERLDNLTCMGCHQAGGTAGFHMLGMADPEFSHPFNRQEQVFSSHESAEVARRIAYTQAVAQGVEPNHFRPHSTFSSGIWQAGQPTFAQLRTGELCFLRDKDFAGRPTCAGECRPTVSVKGRAVLLGECVEKEPSGGRVCWEGEITEVPTPEKFPTYNFAAFQDKWKMTGPTLTSFKNYQCVLPQSGAPLGRMSRRCTLAEENFTGGIEKGPPPAELCANQGGQGFDMCAASGDSGACLETKVARSMLDMCDSSHLCREDYICQQFPDYSKIKKSDYVRKKDGKLINLSTPDKINSAAIDDLHKRGIGFCVPTYFLFNMRLDGHPSPVTGRPPGQPKYDRSQPLRGYQ